MAKKKNKSGKISALIQKVASSFESDYIGTFKGDEAIDLVEEWIPSTNIALNYLAGDPVLGAFPQGRIIELYGPKSSAKSLIVYDAGAQCQKMGGVFILVDSESAFSKNYGKYLGINYDRFLYAHIRTLEEIFDFINSSVERIRKNFGGPILIGWDSVAASTILKELEMDYEDSKAEMGDRARIMSKGMREIGGMIYQENVTWLIVNQIRKKIGVMFGNPETRPGGEAVPFHASVGLLVRRTKQIKKGNRVVGHGVSVFCEKNRVRPPFGKTVINVFIDKVNKKYGLDKWSGLTELLLNDEILVKDGRMLCLTSNSLVKFSEKKISKYWDKYILPLLPKDLYTLPKEGDYEA